MKHETIKLHHFYKNRFNSKIELKFCDKSMTGFSKKDLTIYINLKEMGDTHSCLWNLSYLFKEGLNYETKNALYVFVEEYKRKNMIIFWSIAVVLMILLGFGLYTEVINRNFLTPIILAILALPVYNLFYPFEWIDGKHYEALRKTLDRESEMFTLNYVGGVPINFHSEMDHLHLRTNCFYLELGYPRNREFLADMGILV